jgi:hypothetical protein
MLATGSAITPSACPDRPGDAVALAPVTGTAIVAVGPAASSERLSIASVRPVAAFVAQLIATRQLVPQTRAKRRAHPAEASAAYRAASTPPARHCAPRQSL